MVSFSDKFQRTLATIATAKPTLVLQNATKLSGHAFRVVGSHAPQRGLHENDYQNMILLATDRQFALLPDTLELLGVSTGQMVVSGIVEANLEVRDYKPEEVRANMRVLSENMFMDKGDDSVWKVVTNGDEKYLIQSVQEDFGKLIGSRLARTSAMVVANANYSGLVPATGDYACYYDTERNSLAWGFVIASLTELNVFERSNKKLVKIIPAQVVTAAQGQSLDSKKSLVAFINNSRDGTDKVLADDFTPQAQNAYLDYMRTLYSDTDYFKSLEDLIKLRRNTDVGEIMLNHE